MFVPKYFTNGIFVNPKSFPEHFHCDFTKHVSLPYFINVVLGKLCKMNSGSFLEICPSFFNAIFGIGSNVPKKKVGRPTAFGVVAGMKNPFTFRNITIVESPRQSMCGANTITYSSDSSVSISDLSACPYPAFSKLWIVFMKWSVFVYFLPKPITDGKFFSHIQRFVLSCHAPGPPSRRGIFSLYS